MRPVRLRRRARQLLLDGAGLLAEGELDAVAVGVGDVGLPAFLASAAILSTWALLAQSRPRCMTPGMGSACWTGSSRRESVKSPAF